MALIQLFEFLTGTPMFVIGTWGQTDEEIDDEHLRQLIYVLGPLPANLRTQWPRYSSYYDDNGKSSVLPLFPLSPSTPTQHTLATKT